MANAVSVHDRCIWIVDYLRRTEESNDRTIKDVWQAAQQPEDHHEGGPAGLGDAASLSTYHRTVAKLVRQGQVEEDGELDGAMLYRAARQLSPLSTYTLEDLNAALWEMSVPDAMASYLDAVDYYEKHAGAVLESAAKKLQEQDPRVLILRMLKDQAGEVADDIGILSDPQAHDQKHRGHSLRRLSELQNFVQSGLGINRAIWPFKHLDDYLASGGFTFPEWDRVEQVIATRVIGETFIESIKITEDDDDPARTVVAGTDGSSHAGYVRGIPAPRYVEEQGRLLLIFNNSLAYVELPKGHPARPPSPYHGIPMTRAALEDPQNRGMVLSRPWFDDLTDSQYVHFQKTALDVVQYRVDERLLNGTARAYGTKMGTQEAALIPKPNVLIRDGTVTPQSREFQQYCAQNPYGEMVREGITRSYTILRAVRDSRHRVYAGAVKQTQLRTFSTIINWFIKAEIDPSWDLSKVSVVTDTVAVTRLIDAIEESSDDSSYLKTCAIVRPFPAMVTDLRSVAVDTASDWIDYFETRQRHQRERHETSGEGPSWFAGQEVEDDEYVRMCQHADYASFFFGRPGREPELTLPRFEFMDSLRECSPDAREERVARSCRMIIAAVHRTKWALDREHNFLTKRRMPKLVPYVIYEAHEKCKALGHKLESELRQAIAMRLSQLKALRGLPVPKVDIEPVRVQDYLEEMSPDDKDEQKRKG